MDTTAAPRAKRRRTKPAGLHTAAAADPKPAEEPRIQLQAPPPDAAREGDGVDRISSLPDAMLGEIISLLPTRDGVRTQVLASRWRSLWLSAPLNLDYRSLPADCGAQFDIISRTLAAHPGPVRRFSLPNTFHRNRPDILNAWLRSPAFDSLQELELGTVASNYWVPYRELLLDSIFRFSATLRVLSFAESRFPSAEWLWQHFHLPQLGHLGLERVNVSDNTLHRIIDGCPALRYLLLKNIVGFNTIRINSCTLVCIGFCYDNPYMSNKLIIEDAPSLQRLVQLSNCRGLEVSIISAPKLDTLGCLAAPDLHSELASQYTVFQNLRAASFVEMCRIKVLAVDVNSPESMDALFDLLRWFPCLEKIHIQLSSMYRRRRHLLRRDHLNEIKCLDSNLKTVVLKGYKGTKSHTKFATLFILYAEKLEEMRIEAGASMNSKKCTAERRRLGQFFKKRASRDARLYVTVRRCREDIRHVKCVHDLSKANPFECTC